MLWRPLKETNVQYLYVFSRLATIMEGAEIMYQLQALLSSPTLKQQEERIRGPDSQADC